MGVKNDFSLYEKDPDGGSLTMKCWGEYLGLRQIEYHKMVENYILESFIFYLSVRCYYQFTNKSRSVIYVASWVAYLNAYVTEMESTKGRVHLENPITEHYYINVSPRERGHKSVDCMWEEIMGCFEDSNVPSANIKWVKIFPAERKLVFEETLHHLANN
jgi:hypothetical protein